MRIILKPIVMLFAAAVLSITVSVVCQSSAAANAAAASNTINLADVAYGASVTGSVYAPNGFPIFEAIVTISGPAKATRLTDRTGTFRFDNIPSGTYRLKIDKAGYRTLIVSDVATSPSAPASLSLKLETATFESLVVIGTVHVSATHQTFNTTPAAITVVDRQTFKAQGLQQIDKVLSEIPGVQATLGSSGYPSLNPSIPSAKSIISVRGAQPDESAVYLDGHRIASAAQGSYSPSYLSAFEIETVEAIRGPGAAAPQIANAINGSVNLRLRDPTRDPEGDIQFGIDGWGGTFTDMGLYGTSPNEKWGWAFADGIRGSPGPFQHTRFITMPDGYQYAGRVVNGKIVPAPENGLYLPFSSAPQDPRYENSNFSGLTSLVLCCSDVTSDFTDHSQYGRLRYSFSQGTSLTFTFLGGQQNHDFYGSTGYEHPFTFAPGPGYTGAVPPGDQRTVGFVAIGPSSDVYHHHIYETDFRTNIRKDTVLARWYGFNLFQAQAIGQVGGTSETVRAFGTWDPTTNCGPPPPPCPFTKQTFNGDLIGIKSVFNTPFANQILDRSAGVSLELDHPMGPHLLTLAADDTKLDSSGTTTQLPPNQGFPPPGTFARLRTDMVRGIFELGDKTELTVANYLSSYQLNFVTKYGPNGNSSDLFQNTIATHDDPRVGLVIRPNANMSLRAAVGSGIAPVDLSNFFPSTPPFVQPGNTFAAEILENPNLKPETAFGFNVGGDFRLRNPDTVVSLDLFSNNLFNEILSETVNLGNQTFVGDATFSNGLGPGQVVTVPVFAFETLNLGRARYQGVEAGIRHSPNMGLNFTLQGTLLHAYPYGNGPEFYNSCGSAGKCPGNPTGAPDSNLGVVNGVNFHGFGSFGVPGSTGGFSTSVPYASGYAEVGYRFNPMISLSVGATYYGNYNAFNLPPFVLGNAQADFSLPGGAGYHITVDNLFNTYPQPYALDYQGIPMILVNGKLGLDQATYQGPRLVKLIYSKHFGPGQ